MPVQFSSHTAHQGLEEEDVCCQKDKNLVSVVEPTVAAGDQENPEVPNLENWKTFDDDDQRLITKK